MKINVLWLNYNKELPGRNYWDQSMLEDVLSNRMWRTGYDFEHQEVHNIPKGIDSAVIVLPARNQVEYIEELNKEIRNLAGYSYS